MLARAMPMISLTLVVAALAFGAGCPRVPAPIADVPTPSAPNVAEVQIGEPEKVDTHVGSGTGSAAPAETLLVKEALPKESGDVTDYRALGAKYLAEGRALEAVGAFRVALSSDTSAEAWQMLGEAYVAAGDNARGVPCLEEAVARDATSTTARKVLVKHYLASDDARAHAHAEELVRQRPLDPAARQLLGRAQMQRKMWKEAIAAFELVVGDQPDNIFAHNNIGYSALQIGQLELAREHLERCLSLEPQQGYMLNNLGVTYERLGRGAEAHAAFSRAAELSPRYAQARLNRDRLQTGLDQDDRIVSAETLLRMREPEVVDGAVPVVEADEDRGGDALQDAVDAATGGSARMAPAVIDGDAAMP